jgi:hypothetical protein
MLGKQVEVRLTSEGHEPVVVVRGLFLAYGDFGEFVIQAEDGEVHFCWPLLDIEVVD